MPKKKKTTKESTTPAPAEESTAVATQSISFSTALDNARPQLVRLIGSEEFADKLCRIALTTFNKNPDLKECTQISVLSALVSVTQLGLDLDDVKALAYLIPYMNKKTGNKEAQLRISYKGLVALINRHPDVLKVTDGIVYKNDKFSIEYGDVEKFYHKPFMGPASERGDITHYYAYITLNNGSIISKFMHDVDVTAHMKKYANDTPAWNKSYDSMALKTVLRKVAKLAPTSYEDPALARAIGFENISDAGKSQNLVAEHGFESDGSMAEKTQTKTDELADRLSESKTEVLKSKDDKKTEDPKPEDEATTAKAQKEDPVPEEAEFEDTGSVRAEIEGYLEKADMSPENIEKWSKFLDSDPPLSDLIKNRDKLLAPKNGNAEIKTSLIDLVHQARVEDLISESEEFDYNDSIESNKTDTEWLNNEFDSLEKKFSTMREEAGGGEQGDLNFSDDTN